MPANKDDIVKALAQLDSGNDDHWTDDGLPRVNIMQELTKDPALTRKQISEAAPGFSKAGTEAGKEPEDVQPTDPVDVVFTSTKAAGDGGTVLEHNDGFNLDPRDPLADVLEDDQVHAIMARRIENAQARLEASRAAAQAAVDFVRKCEKFLDRAKLDMNRRFPPTHPADAIKAHLQSQLQQRYDAVGAGHLGPRSTSQIDAAMSIRNKRGWSRAARTA